MLRRLFYWGLLLLSLALLVPAGCYFWISWSSRAYLYDSVQEIPARQVALVLGTAKYTTDGRVNLYYRARIAPALTRLRHSIAAARRSFSSSAATTAAFPITNRRKCAPI